MTAAGARVRNERRAGRAVALVAVAGVGASGAFALREGYALARDVWLLRCTGWGALIALALSLCATPASHLATRASLGRAAVFAAYRRALGLAAATLGTLHFALVLATYLRGAWGAILERPYLRSGLTALVVLLLLAATSFPRVVRGARISEWKPLHRLAYVAGALVAHHVLLSPFAPRLVTLVVLAAVVAVALLRFVGPRRRGRASETGDDANPP